MPQTQSAEQTRADRDAIEAEEIAGRDAEAGWTFEQFAEWLEEGVTEQANIAKERNSGAYYEEEFEARGAASALKECARHVRRILAVRRRAKSEAALDALFHTVMPFVLPCPGTDAPEDVKFMLEGQGALIDLYQRAREDAQTIETVAQQVALGTDYERNGVMHDAMSDGLAALGWVASTLVEDGHEIPVPVDNPALEGYIFEYADGTAK